MAKSLKTDRFLYQVKVVYNDGSSHSFKCWSYDIMDTYDEFTFYPDKRIDNIKIIHRNVRSIEVIEI
jgi:hypothetical protein